jgi:predicted ribosome quality control (RQC) complex YloA/Tae2 family protein
MGKYCEELKKLLEILKLNKEIYISGRENIYHFREYKDNKLFFYIPNRSNSEKPYSKSITVEQFCELLRKLLEKGRLITADFPFKDCRVSAFYGFVNLLYPNQYIKERGKIVKNI